MACTVVLVPIEICQLLVNVETEQNSTEKKESILMMHTGPYPYSGAAISAGHLDLGVHS